MRRRPVVRRRLQTMWRTGVCEEGGCGGGGVDGTMGGSGMVGWFGVSVRIYWLGQTKREQHNENQYNM